VVAVGAALGVGDAVQQAAVMVVVMAGLPIGVGECAELAPPVVLPLPGGAVFVVDSGGVASEVINTLAVAEGIPFTSGLVVVIVEVGGGVPLGVGVAGLAPVLVGVMVLTPFRVSFLDNLAKFIVDEMGGITAAVGGLAAVVVGVPLKVVIINAIITPITPAAGTIVQPIPLIVVVEAGDKGALGDDVIAVLIMLTLTGGIAMGDQVILCIVVVFGDYFLCLLLCVDQCQVSNACLCITRYVETFAPVALNADQVMVGIVMKVDTKTLFIVCVKRPVFCGLIGGVT